MRAVLFTVIFFPTLAAQVALSATAPEGKEKAAPLTSKQLSGTWRGEKGRIEVQITFGGADDATWQVNTKDASVTASLKRVDNKTPGTVHLRLDYVETATGRKGSAVVGLLERDQAGLLRLTILPAATKIDADYKAVESIPLSEVKEKKR